MTQQPRGRLAGRFLKSIVISGGSFEVAAAYASAQRWTESGQIALACKAAVGAMTEGNASHLIAPIGQDLLALTAALSIFGRLTGFRRIPPNTSLTSQTGGAAGFWGDAFQSGGAAVPVSRPTFSRFDGLDERRVSALSVVVEELVRVGMPDFEQTLATDLARALGAATDQAFLNPLSSGSPATSPASATSSGRIFTATGGVVTVDTIDADLERLIAALHDGGSDLTNATWCMNTLTATRLSRMRASGGARAYPDISAKGGTLMGLPVLTTGNILRDGSPSPGSTYLSLIDASRVWVTDRDEIDFRASRQAIIEMSDAPAQDSSSGTGAQQTSMWQVGSVALLATRWLNWQPAAGNGHAATLIGVEY
jgi:Phage capsid family